jgi:septal ring factor EnvC (AmiA/AmiB activator)
MDDSITQETPATFRSPPRILIPKLVKSRDNWKAKANQRNSALKKAQISNRDLSHSRNRWKQRAQDAEQQLRLVQQQLEQTQRQLEQSREEVALLQAQEEKNFIF